MSAKKINVSIFTALALLAMGIYLVTTQFSTPVEQPDPMSEFKAAPAASPGPDSQDSAAGLDSVEVMLVGLRKRLEAQPDDVDGWILLSKSYFHVNQQKQAKQAYDKAVALGYKGVWKPLPRIDSYSRNNLTARKYETGINTRNYKIGQPTETRTADASGQSGAISTTGLKLNVSLQPSLIKTLSPESSVFVFVRTAENRGPPLAVVRKQVADLPFEVVLNDSHAMIPGKTISNATRVIVGARISTSGNAERQAGDYEQLSGSVPANFSGALELVIRDQI